MPLHLTLKAQASGRPASCRIISDHHPSEGTSEKVENRPLSLHPLPPCPSFTKVDQTTIIKPFVDFIKYMDAQDYKESEGGGKYGATTKTDEDEKVDEGEGGDDGEDEDGGVDDPSGDDDDDDDEEEEDNDDESD